MQFRLPGPLNDVLRPADREQLLAAVTTDLYQLTLGPVRRPNLTTGCGLLSSGRCRRECVGDAGGLVSTGDL